MQWGLFLQPEKYYFEKKKKEEKGTG